MFLSCPKTRKRTQPESENRIMPMKRKNFSAEEITFLKKLVEKYRPYQIDNKKTDSINLGEKQRIWDGITREFNTQFPDGEGTTVKQLRKLWDNLKTRRKNELLRERLVVDDESSIFDAKFNMYDKDEISDSLDSNAMSTDFSSAADENSYVNGTSSNNWVLPIETVIIEDDDAYKDLSCEGGEIESEKEVEDCKCHQTNTEIELRQQKMKLILREEEALYKMKKDEQLLKNEIAKVQLKIIQDKKIHLAKKRKLQLQILSKQLNMSNRSAVNDDNNIKFNNYIKISEESCDSKIKFNNNI